MNELSNLNMGTFEVDGLADPVPGYFSAERERCGYPVPLFTLADGLAIAEQVNNSTEYYDVWGWTEPIIYDAERDVFHCYDPETGRRWDWPGELVDIGGQAVKVYPVGGGLWCWAEVTE